MTRLIRSGKMIKLSDSFFPKPLDSPESLQYDTLTQRETAALRIERCTRARVAQG